MGSGTPAIIKVPSSPKPPSIAAIASASVIRAAAPADTHTLARFPCRDTFTDSTNHTNYFVAWDPRILQATEVTFLHQANTVADPTSLDANSHPAGAGFRNLTLYDLQGSARTRNLSSTHLWHEQVRFGGENSRFGTLSISQKQRVDCIRGGGNAPSTNYDELADQAPE